MATVSGIAGFTQLTKLNILDELRVKGVLVSSPTDVIVESVDDLPAASGGFHQLADNTVYAFKGTGTTSPDYLNFGTGSLIKGD